MVEIARALNPRIETLIRTHSDEEAALLRRDNLGTVFMGEHELALAMTRGVLELGRRRPRADRQRVVSDGITLPARQLSSASSTPSHPVRVPSTFA
jgi:voltage-gated potassium channel Kch